MLLIDVGSNMNDQCTSDGQTYINMVSQCLQWIAQRKARLKLKILTNKFEEIYHSDFQRLQGSYRNNFAWLLRYKKSAGETE